MVNFCVFCDRRNVLSDVDEEVASYARGIVFLIL